MSKFFTVLQRGVITLLLGLMCGSTSVQAQETTRETPNWWFGVVGAANFNYHRGTSQMLTSTFMTPAPFHKGYNVGPYAGLLVEYRPGPVWGLTLNAGYDDRRGVYDTVMSGCDCPGDLTTTLSYLSISPSLRVAPFSSGLYLFAGPRIGINLDKSFTFKQDGKPGYVMEGDFSDTRSPVISGEVGIGLDMLLGSPNAATQVAFSPFVSIQPYFGQDPRSVETWNVTTLRVGAALKFGHGKVIPPPAAPVVAVQEMDPEVRFAVQAPDAYPAAPRVWELFPLRNYVFFDAGSQRIPGRYVSLTPDQGSAFREAHVQVIQPATLDGRSDRQLAVYYNIVNILGDRMRSNPEAGVRLVGSSGRGATDGMELANAVKSYLVTVFGISSSRIETESRIQPTNSSDAPGLTNDRALRLAENRRVDIESASQALLVQVGGPADALKPVLLTPNGNGLTAGHAVFTVTGAREVLTSWRLEVTDPQSTVQRFGPFTRDQETIAAETILGTRPDTEFRVVMIGKTRSGRETRKEDVLRLNVPAVPVADVQRFSVLFTFDRSVTMANYEQFLRLEVAPRIKAGSRVTIHGHTDSVGDVAHNQTLANERAAGAERILRSALVASGTTGVTFVTVGYGEDTSAAPFANTLPEQRFYNRTVIIDVGPTM